MNFVKGRSLLDLKKQQWAKEKEELSQIGEMFSHSSSFKTERTSIRTYYSNLDLSQTSALNNNYDSTQQLQQQQQLRSSNQQQKLRHQFYDQNIDNRRLTSSNYELINVDDDYTMQNQYQQPKYYDSGTLPAHPPIHLGHQPSQNQSQLQKQNLQRIRSPSLPAIRNPEYATQNNRNNHSFKQPLDESTSGYLSDSFQNPHSPDIWYNDRENNSGHGQTSSMSKEYKDFHNNQYNINRNYRHINNGGQNGNIGKFEKINTKLRDTENIVNNMGNGSNKENGDGYSSTYYVPASPMPSRDISTSGTFQVYPDTRSSYYQRSKDERAKWNNNHKYPSDNSSIHIADRLDNFGSKNGPEWLNRSLESKETEDDLQSVNSSTFIRGQNVPVDPAIMVERMNKRRKALEYQNAIKQQLEEQERIRQWELERHLREERVQEERALLKQQLEEERLQKEHQKQEEKQEAQRKKQEALLQAIVKAEEEAKLEKARKRKNKILSNETQAESSNNHIENVVVNQVKVSGVPNDVKTKFVNEQKNTSSVKNSKTEETEQKVLIGTPINLRKTFKKSTNSEKQQPLNISNNLGTNPSEGIALVLQPTTLIPLPVTTDVIGLQNPIGNLQIAAYLMQQQPGFVIQQPKPPQFESEDDDEDEITPRPESAESKSDSGNGSIPESFSSTITLKCNVQSEEISGNCENSKSEDDSDFNAHSTENDNNFQGNKNESALNSSKDAETQTELPLNCDLCLFHDNFYKVYLKRETTTTTTTNSKLKSDPTIIFPDKSDSPSEKEANNGEMTTTTTTTTTTTYRAKPSSKKFKDKLDNRPKWGVNRPVVQYVKASDRDPFYLRNKKKKSTKPSRSLSVDSRLNADEEGGFVLKARNVCTEILPIKTDEKGRIFLNFREASTIMNEDEIKEKLREKYLNFGKVLVRRNWNQSAGVEMIIPQNELIRSSSIPHIEIKD